MENKNKDYRMHEPLTTVTKQTSKRTKYATQGGNQQTKVLPTQENIQNTN